jgi:tetratricopeptide (TPR) repeat protein
MNRLDAARKTGRRSVREGDERARTFPRIADLALGLVLLGAVSVAAAEPVSTPDPEQQRRANESRALEAFDYGFRFASAIHTDPKDKARAQEEVLLDLAHEGSIDRAVDMTGLMAGWRRASVLADLAGMMAGAGRAADARNLLARAEQLNAEVGGWQHRRVQSHIAQALARLGQADRSEQLTRELAEVDSRQYAGRSAATLAAAHAATGDFDGAMRSLGAVGASKDFDVVWWRTLGYIELAREEGRTVEQRRRALDAAVVSAADIDGWKQGEALIEVANELAALKDVERARELLKQSEPWARSLADTAPVKVPLLSRLARGWHTAGMEARARERLAEAERAVPSTMNIDRPMAWATVASVYRAIGAEKDAKRLYDVAFSSAEALVNARPRALAVVEICRSIGRDGVALDPATRERLDRLFYGLQDPW